MALKKFICPPTPATGAGTFSDDLVGFQLVQGGGLTQGNFEFTTATNEKQNRNFLTGLFSEPFNLENLGLDAVVQSKIISETNFKVYPNYDLSQVVNFTIFGSMIKRMSVSIEQIISYFPAALESTTLGLDYTTGITADNIFYDQTNNETSLELTIERIRNPFEIDFTVNATRNLELKEIKVSELRNLTVQTTRYSLFYEDKEYKLKRIIPTTSLTNGILRVIVEGNPFNFQTFTYNNIVIRPNDFEVNKIFKENFDEVQRFLLNRTQTPKYTAIFTVPKENDDGTYYTTTQNVTWPLYGPWNLDIITSSFVSYLEQINDISESFDSYRTNLVSRFFTTGAFKDFDTINQKVEKVLQIYGRSFDETNKFINALAFMNSVNYNTGNDIPSQLLKNLAETLGWNISMSPISEDNFLSSVFGETKAEKSMFTGVPNAPTPEELNYNYYRNIVLNAAYLFKSKGTRKAIEGLLRLIGAPESLVEFNEYVYVADQRINMRQFNTQYTQLSGGTYLQEIPSFDFNDIYTIQGVQYTGFTTSAFTQDVNIAREEYPVDDDGYPSAPPERGDYFFQSGSGWFEQTPSHRALPQVNITDSVFTGNNPNFQTTLVPYQYGQDYFNRFRNFPYMKLGYSLQLQRDNNKSWAVTETNFRINTDAGYVANYFTEDERLVLNAKNIDLFLNPGQGILYDIWSMSRLYNYPIPVEGLNYVPPSPCDLKETNLLRVDQTPFTASLNAQIYPYPGGKDWTIISPQPQNKTFFEFAQTLTKNTINARNRQTAKGYPTLLSIFWKYIESQETAGLENNNFNYKNMSEYVNGLGDYWIRLVEQMIPGSTIWNTGTKIENMAIHRQKIKWRRQVGCQLIPVPCNPCYLTGNLYTVDCPTQSLECLIYPWQENPRVQSLGNVLAFTLESYLSSNGYSLPDCQENSIQTQWYADIRVEDVPIVQNQFFNGFGYGVSGTSYPTETDWLNGLTQGLEDLKDFGYEYYFTDENTVVIYNSICSAVETNINLKINVGINFNIICS